MQASPLQYKFLECILEEDESSCTEQSSSIQTVSEQPQIEPSASTSYDYSAPKYGRAASTNHSLAQDSYHHYHQLQPIQESDESDAYEHDDYNEVWYPSDQSLSCAEDGNGKRSSRTKKSANQFVAYVPHMLMKGSDEGDDGGQPCWDEEMITVIVDDYPSSEEEESDEALFVKKKRALRKKQEEEEHEYDADRSDDEGGDYVMGVQVLESHVLLSTFLEMARER